MYDVIVEIIGHEFSNSNYGTSFEQIIFYICCVLICVFTTVFLDLIYRVFRHFWR